MKLYKYKNYDEYVKSQISACEKKHKNEGLRGKK